MTTQTPIIKKIPTPKKPGSSVRLTLDTPIQYLKGIGPRLAMLFQQKEIFLVRDLLYYLPRDYQDRTKSSSVKDAQPGEKTTIRGRIGNFKTIPLRSRKTSLLQATLTDSENNKIFLKWFHFNPHWLQTKYREDEEVLAFGEIQIYSAQKEMIHPEIMATENTADDLTEDSEDTSTQGIFSIYSETEGLNQRTIHKAIEQVFSLINEVEEDLPENILKTYQLPTLANALTFLHRPPTDLPLNDIKNFATPAQRRLIFEECFKFEWLLAQKRVQVRSDPCYSFQNTEIAQSLIKNSIENFFHKLTADQNSALEKIFEDLALNKPMNRLLQGDVGCGKTVVAMISALPVIAEHAQVALMVPTEILCTQHFINAEKLFRGVKVSGRDLKVAMLSGSTTKKIRAHILTELNAGNIDLLIGTHALIEDDVKFTKLGLVIIDEQHRFGVDQRMKLRSKSKTVPHILSMTATPIPRTLAMTAYGDLDSTIIRQRPSGRKPVETKIFNQKNIDTVYSFLKSELDKKHQAYIIYPLVEESEKIDLQNAVEGAELLANGPLREYKIGLLHGRMTSDEKQAVMSKFKAGLLDVLVSTTVIEVGVDVANASVLVIQHSERFGLSQLHQLRGRVGRGANQSYCFLMNQGASELAIQRLKAMENTEDGFKLAELDLEIRGPGDFLGTRQSGDLNFKFTNLVRDSEIIENARKAAFHIMATDPRLLKDSNLPLMRYLIRKGDLQKSRLGTA